MMLSTQVSFNFENCFLARSQNFEKRLVASLRLFFRWNSALTGRIWIKFDI